MYEVTFTPRADKRLKEISKQGRVEVGQVIEDLKNNPYIGKPLQRNLIGRLSYRIGLYRITYKIYEKEKIVKVLTVGHRSIVYN